MAVTGFSLMQALISGSETTWVQLLYDSQRFGPPGTQVKVSPGDAGSLASRGLAFLIPPPGPPPGQYNPTAAELNDLAVHLGLDAETARFMSKRELMQWLSSGEAITHETR